MEVRRAERRARRRRIVRRSDRRAERERRPGEEFCGRSRLRGTAGGCGALTPSEVEIILDWIGKQSRAARARRRAGLHAVPRLPPDEDERARARRLHRRLARAGLPRDAARKRRQPRRRCWRCTRRALLQAGNAEERSSVRRRFERRRERDLASISRSSLWASSACRMPGRLHDRRSGLEAYRADAGVVELDPNRRTYTSWNSSA